MPRSSKSEAEVRFAKAQARQRDAVKALSDAEMEAKRVDDNTVRLRALRVARDAKLAEEAAAAAESKAAAVEAKAAAKDAKSAKKATPKAKAKTA